MAYSIIETVGNGTSQYPINFTLGFNSRTEVQCRVNNAVDGLGDPVYADLTWINDGLVEVAGGPYDADDDLVFTRTVDKTELIHDYGNGEAIEESNLDESNKQNLMAIHEVLDGRLPSALVQDLDMGNHKIVNLADGVDPQDAVTVGQVDLDVLADSVAAAAASAVAADDSADDSAASAALADTSADNALVSETNAAASAAAANAAVQSALWRDVVFVSSDTVIDSTYNGKLVRVDTSGGVKTITLPTIAGLTLPFNFGVEKQTGDANAVNIVRASTDTIDGATSKALTTQGAGAALVADTSPSPDEWTALEFGPVDLSLYALKGANADITSLTACTAITGLQSINGGQLGGLRNKIINGDFRRWDYATTYALQNSALYGSANRWAFSMGATAAGIANQDVPGATLAGFRYCLKLGRNAASSSLGQINAFQALESSNSIPMAGNVVTLSFYAKKGANYSSASSVLNANVYSGTGTDQSVSTIGGWTGNISTGVAHVITTSWARYQMQVTLPTTITQLAVQFSYTPVGTAGADDNVYITGVQLEIGNQATVFEDRGESIEELLCRRYFRKTFNAAVKPVQNNGLNTGEFRFMAGKAGASSEFGYVALNPPMRGVPTLVTYNPAAANGQVRDYTIGGDCSATAAADLNQTVAIITATGNASTAVGNMLAVHYTLDAEL